MYTAWAPTLAMLIHSLELKLCAVKIVTRTENIWRHEALFVLNEHDHYYFHFQTLNCVNPDIIPSS